MTLEKHNNMPPEHKVKFSVLHINCLLPLLPLESVYSDQIGMVNM